MFRVIDAFAVDLTEELEKRHFDFHQTALSGIEEQLPLWRRGVEASNGILGEVVGKLYVEKHFPPEAKQRMVEMEIMKKGLRQTHRRFGLDQPSHQEASSRKTGQVHHQDRLSRRVEHYSNR